MSDEKLTTDRTPFGHRRNKSSSLFLIGGGIIVVLALALGLGLGLGLKKHNSSNSSSSGSSQNSTFPTGTLQPQNLSSFILLPSGIQSQASKPQTREFVFNITRVTGAPDGFERGMFVVNGMFPGPTIEVNQDDRLVVTVHNNINNVTAIHWHGLFQNGTNYYDGSFGITECGIKPGSSQVYNFTFGEFSGTTWWHAHASTLYTDGITGALIVHPSSTSSSSSASASSVSNPAADPKVDAEIVIQMNDWYHTESGELLVAYFDPFGLEGTPGNEPVSDSGTINGYGQYGSGGQYFNATVQPSKTYRLRLINTGSFSNIRFSVDHHPLTVVEVDGTLVEPMDVNGVTLAVAQRYSVLLKTKANVTGVNYWMRAEVSTDAFTYDLPGQNTDIRGILKYASPSSSLNDSLPVDSDDPGPGLPNLDDLDPSTLVPAEKVNALEPTKRYHVNFHMGNTADGRWLSFMNDTSWDPLSGTFSLLKAINEKPTIGPSSVDDQLMITEDGWAVIDLSVDNLDDGDHPFHLHGHRPWIMGFGDGRYIGQPLNSTNPIRRDTQLIPAYTWVVFRFVVDNPGLWAFHCHIAWHMAAGLLMQINSLPTKAGKELTIPADILQGCKA